MDERTGLVHDYTRRGGVESATVMLADGSTADRGQLWNAAEKAENRKDARTAREWVIALPAELDADQRQTLAREFGGELARRYGVAVDVAIHAPGGEGDQRNHHAHVLTTTRQVMRDASGALVLGEKATIELSDKKRRELGLAPAADEVKAIRELWEQQANRALERAGRSERIDARSLVAQGIDREPTVHLGPTAAEMERRGAASDRGDMNRDVHARQRERFALLAARETVERQIAAEVRSLAEERRRQEQQRIASMTPAELSAEIERVRPRPAKDVAKHDPAVIGAGNVVERARQAHAQATKAQRAAEEWREAHPWKDRAARWGLWRWPQVDAWDAQAAQLPKLAEAYETASGYERQTWRQTLSRVETEQLPALAQVRDLELRRDHAIERGRQQQAAEKGQQLRAERLAGELIEAARLRERGKLLPDAFIDDWRKRPAVAAQLDTPWKLREETAKALRKDPKLADVVAQVLAPHREAMERAQQAEERRQQRDRGPSLGR